MKEYKQSYSKKQTKIIMSKPTSVKHLLHIDKDLNWIFDTSIDPMTFFSEIKTIGKGGFGTVMQVLHIPSQKIFAGKLIHPKYMNGNLKKCVENEIKMMKDVDSKYTVQYYGSVPFKDSLLILMEYCDRGSFRQILDAREKVLSEDQISIVISDLLKGLDFIHKKHIIHRDVKSGNILFNSKGEVKITDFGISKSFSFDGTCHTCSIIGTPYWMAPEVINGEKYSYKADIWSVGITAIELSEGAPPLIELPPSKAMIEISLNGFPGFRFPSLHSSEFIDFVMCCLEMDENERPTISKLLEHPFIKRAERLDRNLVLDNLVNFDDDKDFDYNSGEDQIYSNNDITSEFMDSQQLIQNSLTNDLSIFNCTAENIYENYLQTNNLGKTETEQSTSSIINQMGKRDDFNESLVVCPDKLIEDLNQISTMDIETTNSQNSFAPLKECDSLYINTSRQISAKIPFSPLQIGTKSVEDIKTIYCHSTIKLDSEIPVEPRPFGQIILKELSGRGTPLFLTVFLVLLIFIFYGQQGIYFTLFFFLIFSVYHAQYQKEEKQKNNS